MKMTMRRQAGLALVAGGAMLLMQGCGMGTMGVSAPSVVAGVALQGKVYGGQQPVSGSVIQLYQVGTGGYGTAAQPLISSVVKSAPDGGFSITGTYTCTTGAQLYITATGGNPGFSNNANLALMSALTPCGTLTPTTAINLNEVTTVASVWALAPFMTSVTNVGTTAMNVTGLANAFSDVNTLVDTTTGAVPAVPVVAGATVPAAEIYSLANVIAACVNSSGGTAGDSTVCGQLFTLANPGGTPATAPTNTIAAALNIAKNPTKNVASIFALAGSSPPFGGGLTTAPNDFTLAVNYTTGGFSGPAAVAVDASGDVWVVNKTGATVSELSHTGAPISTGQGFTASLNLPTSIAIDSSGGAWITNSGNATVSRLSSVGAAIGTPYSGGGLNHPSSVSLDSVGNAWVSNAGGASVTKIDGTGVLTNYTPAGATAPLGIGVTPH